MRIGLVSYRCENRNVAFNLKQIETAMQRAQGSADFLCFGEAFLQGFECLDWEYKKDRNMALALTSEEITLIRKWTVQYGSFRGPWLYRKSPGSAVFLLCDPLGGQGRP